MSTGVNVSGGLQKTRPKNIYGNERGTNELLVTFSAPGAPGTPLGHPWGPKWSQDLPQEPPGPPEPQFFKIFGANIVEILAQSGDSF